MLLSIFRPTRLVSLPQTHSQVSKAMIERSRLFASRPVTVFVVFSVSVQIKRGRNEFQNLIEKEMITINHLKRFDKCSRPRLSVFELKKVISHVVKFWNRRLSIQSTLTILQEQTSWMLMLRSLSDAYVATSKRNWKVVNIMWDVSLTILIARFRISWKPAQQITQTFADNWLKFN